ncbi:MAG: type I pullulanase [Gudongella sp.]|jgi:pullulanase|nr:type I pullulanase [Gudongella sp.]
MVLKTDIKTTNKTLGAICTPQQTVFRVYAPLREKINLRLYEGASHVRRAEHPMTKESDGVFSTRIEGDLDGKFYTYIIEDNLEITDPYSTAVSCNSMRSAVIDLSKTNPDGWEEHEAPELNNISESIIYEVHVKDFTAHPSFGVEEPGTFKAFSKRGTKYKDFSTGIDHLTELGVTHVHLMPVSDFITVREEPELRLSDDNYNWGYDPEHYNAVEGTYSTDPYDPHVRVRELKELIMSLHKAGLRVVLDVVYNHTFRSKDSNFNQLYPNFYRTWPDGTLSDGSGCGNELNTEDPMVRKFIIESLEYWTREFKVDGFRFDLMALMDLDTMELITKRLKAIRPDILIYGEPWTGGATVLPSNKTTSRGSQGEKGFSIFNDSFRDALKGDNDGYGTGFAQGNLDKRRGITTGATGSIFFDEGHIGFASRASESVNYANSHDNLILQDKLLKTLPGMSDEEYIRYNKFVHSILFFSMGIPFIHAGNEFMRTKRGLSNSYNAPISINAIDWSLKEKNYELFSFIKDLIEFRKSRPEFKMDDADEIRKAVDFIESQENCYTLGYTIKTNGTYLLIIHNANRHSCLLPHLAIRKHLQMAGKRTILDMEIRCLFNETGIIRGAQGYWHPHGVEVHGISSCVFEIKP